MAHSLVCVGHWLILISVLIQSTVPLPTLESRYQRHADGLFTSEYSKLKNNAAMRNHLKTLLISKRSFQDFPNSLEEDKHTFEEDCFEWLYYSFLSESLSDNEALEATQKSHKSLCPAFGHLISSLSEYIPKSLGVKE